MSVPFAVKFGYRSVPQHGLRGIKRALRSGQGGLPAFTRVTVGILPR
jgi:hypothetical protein